MSLIDEWPLFGDFDNTVGVRAGLTIVEPGAQSTAQLALDLKKGKVCILRAGAYLEVAGAPAVYPFSACFWIKTIEEARDFWGIGSDPAGAHFLMRTQGSGAVRLGARDSTASHNLNGAFVITDGDAEPEPESGGWHHVAAVFAANNDRRLYVDGAPEGPALTAIAHEVAVLTMRFGRGPDAASSMDCSLFGVRVFDHALTPAEVVTQLQETDRKKPAGRRSTFARGFEEGMPRL